MSTEESGKAPGAAATPRLLAGRPAGLAVLAIPFLVSLSCSLATISNRVSWQDSGFYLTGIYELSVLYPPGFVVYQVLCKLWTLALFFVDFTLAVHLFSSICAALASATIAITVRDLLKAQGPLFNVADGNTGSLAGWCGASTGCIAASGYTFWLSGIMAKGYAFYYLVMTLLIWRMIRAAESRSPRDFTVVAVFIGLLWQAHPSGTLTGLALLLFVGVHRTLLGWQGIGIRTLVASGVALGPTLILLILGRRDVHFSFGAPESPGDLFRFVLGSRFTAMEGAWGWEATRAASVGLYLWEEMLGIGLALSLAGLVRIALVNRPLFLGLFAWILPLLVVTVAFTIEGQHDFWFMGAWIPLHLVAGVGLCSIARRAARHGRILITLAGALSIAWAVTVNGSLVNQRTNYLPEKLGKVYLKPLDQDAVAFLGSDDALAVCRYLQLVRGYRPDVLILNEQDLTPEADGRPGHIYRRMMKRDSRLIAPDFRAMRARFPNAAAEHVRLAAFLEAQFPGDRPIFMSIGPPIEMLPTGCAPIPAGPLVKFVGNRGEKLNLSYWDFGIQPTEVLPRLRRKRGQRLEKLWDGRIRAVPEPYEERLLRTLLHARLNLADFIADKNPQHALRLYDEARRLFPAVGTEGRFLFQWGRLHLLLGRPKEAQTALRMYLSLETKQPPALVEAARRLLEGIDKSGGS